MIRYAQIDAGGRIVNLTKSTDLAFPTYAPGEWVECGPEVRLGQTYDRAMRSFSGGEDDAH